jgi:NADH-quinone oxidoreductase subunit N
LVLLVTGLVLMLADAFKAVRALPIITAVGVSLSALSAGVNPGTLNLHYNFMMYFGGLANANHVFLCMTVLISLFFIDDYFKRYRKEATEVYSLMVFALIGMIMLANANDLIILFIGLEIMSVSLYILAGLFPREPKSNEAGLKYFLLGAFATGFLLYGIALLYGLSGMEKGAEPTTRLNELAVLVPGLLKQKLFYLAVGLLLIGFLFKVAAFPFHSWTPDVYTGTPTPLAGFMATGSKLAAFIAFANFLRIVMEKSNPETQAKIATVLGVLALASMIYGNLVAVQQTNIKRILAYSSIAHTGYVMLGLCAGPKGYMAVNFYMVTYSIMSLGAFGIISMVESQYGDAELNRWRGLGRWRPGLGIAMSTFLFSLSGMPPLAGFMGKYLVFGAAIESGLYVLTTVAILTSVIGAYYYLRILVVMYFEKETEAPTGIIPNQFVPLVGALLLVAITIGLGVYPTAIYGFLDRLYGQAQLLTLLP